MFNVNFYGIIPSRAGSKRLPGKVMRSLGGKPMVQWTFEASDNCTGLKKTFLTSNDPAVIELAKDFKVEVPFVRDEALAQDNSSSVDVILDLLERVGEIEDQDYIVLLQPTSPLRISEDIQDAISQCIDQNCESVLAVTETEKPLSWSFYESQVANFGDFYFSKMIPNMKEKKQGYQINGAIYIINVGKFKEYKSFVSKENASVFPMPRSRSVDIDTLEDFIIAETLLNHLKGNVENE